ncbi:hypothetical protein ACFLTM_03695 [Candidatus Bipolaricaulota bacterium]
MAASDQITLWGAIMRKPLVLFLLLVFFAFTASAGELFQAEGFSEGTTVIWFLGTEITTDFEGTQDLRGTLTLEGTDHRFFVSGDAYGAGVADSMTLSATLWVVFYATGTLETGEPITIRGGMEVGGEEVDLDALSFGGGGGAFFFIVDLPGATYEFAGSVESTASGVLVPATDPSSMEVAGTANSTFAGEVCESDEDFAARLPWDTTTWPIELHEQLLTLLLTGVMPERAEDEPQPPEPTPRREP